MKVDPIQLEKGKPTEIRFVGSAATFRLETVGGTIVEFKVQDARSVTVTAGDDIMSASLTINEDDVVRPGGAGDIA